MTLDTTKPMTERELVAKWRKDAADYRATGHGDDAVVAWLVDQHADELEALLNSRVGGEVVAWQRRAMAHVADELNGQLNSGLLADLPIMDKVYFAQLAFCLRDPSQLIGNTLASPAPALRGGEQDEAECRIHNQPKAACDEQFRLGCDPVRAAPSPGGVEPCPFPDCEARGTIHYHRVTKQHRELWDPEIIRPTPPEVTEAQARSVRDDISRAFIKDPSSLDNIETWRSALTAALAGGK